jgi:hypothetical protein
MGGTSPKNCDLFGGNGNRFKLKTTAKLKDIDRLCPSPIPHVRCLLDPLWFSEKVDK